MKYLSVLAWCMGLTLVAPARADRIYTLVADMPFADSPFGFSGSITTDGSTGAVSGVNFIKDWSITIRTPSEVDGIASEVFTRSSGPPLVLAFGPIFASESSLALRASAPSLLVLGQPPVDITSIVWKSATAGGGGIFGGGNISAYVQITDLGEAPESAKRNFGVSLGVLSNFVFAGGGVAIPEPSALVLTPVALAAILVTTGATRLRSRRAPQIAAGILSVMTVASTARADIYQWEYVDPADPSQGKRQSALLAPDGAGVDAVPGVTMIERNLTMGYLVGADLRNAVFLRCTLTDADFTQAKIQGASFSRFSFTGPQGTGIALTQLYSTASYEARDLSRTSFSLNDLSGGNFAGQNFANASFPGTNLNGTDFAGADVRGAFVSFDDWNVTTTNLILPDGHISGLNLDADLLLVVRDYDGRPESGAGYPPIPITIDQHLSMAPGGTLRMVFEADAWDSTISFAPGIPVTLGGTLELTFADDVNLPSQRGRTFDLFDWTGVAPTGAFTISSPYTWDLSNLYTTGKVTLTAIPEPGTLLLLLIAETVECIRRNRFRKT